MTLQAETTAAFNRMSERLVLEKPKAHEKSGEGMLSYLENNGIRLDGEAVRGVYNPKLFSSAARQLFDRLARLTASVGLKAIGYYKKNPSFRQYYRFSDELDRLIRMDTGYGTHLPMLRSDIFYDEETGDYRFCEFNTDGSSGMIEDRELVRAFERTCLYQELEKKGELESFELIDSLAAGYRRLYFQSKTFLKSRERFQNGEIPTAALVDFLEKASTLDEFEVYRRAFEKLGMRGLIADVRQLTYDGRYLRNQDGQIIDMIYRRAVTSDIMQRRTEAESLIEAAGDGNVCLLGGFETQVIHDKGFMLAIQDKDFGNQCLTEEEKEAVVHHLPPTAYLTGQAIEAYDLPKHKNDWVLKPVSSYGSRGVVMGSLVTEKEWQKALQDNLTADYLVQQKVEPFKSRHVDYRRDGEFHEYYNTTGIYVVDGQLLGLYSRVSPGPVITTHLGACGAASLIYRNKKNP